MHNLGVIHHQQGNYEEAVNLYNKSLKISEELGNKSGISNTLHQLGIIHQRQGNYEEAVEQYNQSLEIKEELGDKSGIAATLGQLGRIYLEKKEYSYALQAFLTTYSIFKALNSPTAQLAEKDLVSLRDKMGEEEFNAQIEKLVNE